MDPITQKFSIASLLERIARLMRAAEHDTNLNPAQWEALRYLARCNRFSNSPGALKDYLAATKGTISQTLKTLERKGLIEKTNRPGDGRSVALALTAAGSKTLSWDPWQRLEVHVKEIAPENRRGLLLALRAILAQEIARNRLKTFGTCRRCRHFRLNAAPNGSSSPHQCDLYRLPLSAADAEHICADHEPRARSDELPVAPVLTKKLHGID